MTRDCTDASGAEDAIIRVDAPEDALGPSGPGESWVVLHTRSRREKQVARTCERLALRHYLPLQPSPRSRSRSRSRGVAVEVPLFPGYVFLCSSPGERLDVLALGAVVRVLPVRRPEILLEELRRIRRVVEAGAQVSPAAGFPLGRRVRVIGGALLGLEAETADRRSRRGVLRLVLRVSMLGQAALVEIDPEDVELLPVTRERCSEPGSGRRVRPAGWEGHSPAGTV